MNSSVNAVLVLHSFESCKLEAYPDPGSKDGHPWTIGYGHTGPEVVRGLRWTQREADDVFEEDLVVKGEMPVNRFVRVPLTQGQYDALVCFVFNIGAQAFRDSTLLSMLNEGNYVAAGCQFARWIRNAGKPMLGLVRRRHAELLLWEGRPAKEAIAKAWALTEVPT